MFIRILKQIWRNQMYHISNLTKIYKTAGIETRALNGINLDIPDHKFVIILGESGSGKTTLLNMLGGLDTPTDGDIMINGQNITELSDEKMAEYRRQKIGFVFQHFNLIPTLTVYENIILPIILDKRKEEETYILQLLEKLGLSEKKDAYPHQLSGGQQQRVAIARAFANKPEVILADEPTGNLDSKTGRDVVDLLLKMHEVYKQTIIMITHNEKIAQYADIVIRIKDGTILNGRKV